MIPVHKPPADGLSSTVPSSEERAALEIIVKERDVWLSFRASSGKECSLSIAALADGKRGIVGMALRDWARDRILEARHYHIGPGDVCGQCGKDIRNEIHLRVGEKPFRAALSKAGPQS